MIILSILFFLGTYAAISILASVVLNVLACWPMIRKLFREEITQEQFARFFKRYTKLQPLWKRLLVEFGAFLITLRILA